MILSKLLVALGLDAGEYNRGLDDAEKTAGTKAQAIGEKLGSIGDKMTGVGTKLTAGVTLPIVAMGMKAIDAASDLDESMNKVNVVFGDSAAMVQSFADTADTALGQSTQQALEAAGTFGNLFTAMEIGQPKAADMSTSLVTLASDLASFNNATPTEALDALRAGLTGETEPLKRFGVNLNAATIAAKALELGLVDLDVDMTKVQGITLDLEKAEADLAAMTRGVSKDSEQYRNVQARLAEEQRKLNDLTKGASADSLEYRDAQLKVTEAQNKLNKAVEKYGSGSTEAQRAALNLEKAQSKYKETAQGASTDSDEYQKQLTKVAEAQRKLRAMTQGVSKDSLEYREQQQKVLELQAKLDEAMQGTAGELSAAAKAQAVYALVMEQTTTAQGDFSRTSEGMANQTRIMRAQLENAAATMGQHLLPYGLKLVTMINDLIGKFKSLDPETQKTIITVAGIAAAIGPLLVVLGTLISSVGSVIGVLGGVAGVLTGPVGLAIAAVVGAIALLYAAWTNNWGGIQEKTKAFWENTLKPAFEKIAAWLGENIPIAMAALKSFWENTLLPAFRAIAAWLGENIPKAIAVLKQFWEEKLLPALQAVWQFIETYLVPLFEALANVVIAILKKELEALSGLWQNVLKPALEAVWGFIQESVIPVLQEVARVVSEVLGPVLDWLKVHILDPLVGAFSGIGDAISDVIGWLTDLANGISNLTLPDWLTPGSPTPFELGLVGIADAMGRLARMRLPELSAGLRLVPGPMPLLGAGAMPAPAVGRGQAPSIEINFRVERMDVSSKEAAEKEAKKLGKDLSDELRRRGLFPKAA